MRRINATLRYYEKEYIELKRIPFLEREVCKSFEQFVEIRFNMESYNSGDPLLMKLEEDLGGHLFRCTNLEGPDEVKKRFKWATVELISTEDVENPDENLKNELDQLKSRIGGSKITFNSVQHKIKLIIDEN